MNIKEALQSAEQYVKDTIVLAENKADFKKGLEEDFGKPTAKGILKAAELIVKGKYDDYMEEVNKVEEIAKEAGEQ